MGHIELWKNSKTLIRQSEFLKSQIDTCYLRNLLIVLFFFPNNHDNKFKALNAPEIFGSTFTHYLTIAFENVIFYFCQGIELIVIHELFVSTELPNSELTSLCS